MSTTFEIYPQSAAIPSFHELIQRGRQRLVEQLLKRGVNACPNIEVSLRRRQTHESLPLDLNSETTWENDKYAWFYVPHLAGGTDAYYRVIEDNNIHYWNEILDTHAKAQLHRNLVQACLCNNHYWFFRRSAGQPAIISFAYGILAASLAELTNGIIFSDDGAWDYEQFPATADEFYEWYFVPAMALEVDEAEWAQQGLEAIADELRV